jgi:hypothetical protein
MRNLIDRPCHTSYASIMKSVHCVGKYSRLGPTRFSFFFFFSSHSTRANCRTKRLQKRRTLWARCSLSDYRGSVSHHLDLYSAFLAMVVVNTPSELSILAIGMIVIGGSIRNHDWFSLILLLGPERCFETRTGNHPSHRIGLTDYKN